MNEKVTPSSLLGIKRDRVREVNDMIPKYHEDIVPFVRAGLTRIHDENVELYDYLQIKSSISNSQYVVYFGLSAYLTYLMIPENLRAEPLKEEDLTRIIEAYEQTAVEHGAEGVALMDIDGVKDMIDEDSPAYIEWFEGFLERTAGENLQLRLEMEFGGVHVVHAYYLREEKKRKTLST